MPVVPLTPLVFCLVLLCPHASLAGAAWVMPDSDTWKVLGSVGAVTISLLALVVSSFTTREKTARELRDELKKSIEKLIDFRKEASDAQSELAGVLVNSRKAIYLESAEYLASKVRHVTSAEWRVLGSEYLVDSHFVKAESLFAQAVRVSRDGSLASQAESLQGRAGAAMMQGADGQKRGRDTFREAEQLVTGRNDLYSTYMLAHTYRVWAASEFQVGNLTDARDRLMDAVGAVRQIPEWTPAFRVVELSACMQILMALTDRFLALSELAAGRACLDQFAEAIRLDQNEIAREALGQIYWRRAVLESAAGNFAAVEQFRELARAALETLPETNATRAALLGGAPASTAAQETTVAAAVP